MITITMESKGSFNRNSISSINQTKIQGALTSQNIAVLNKQAAQKRTSAPPRTTIVQNQQTQAPPSLPRQKPPALLHPVQKGQKTPLASSALNSVNVCFGWNTSNPQCDIDVSAFLLGANGKVPGDSWFVFYGQTTSPDKSCRFRTDTIDREIIEIDFNKLDSKIQKIVFVLTINDAFTKKLHFGMAKDAYVRILQSDHSELVSYQMTDYYSNVISMMIGELYQYHGIWKFNAVGNGVAKDLAGLCALYGVQVSD